ncbi:DUF2381 family protein [Pyxidicoccus fallax]|uniref:DUF2381 family protein n=1 Tax=Pyxidicoccus fallax TaxID=394095 RepID=A0A848LID2_9BACT|nr:DUF2381 family protein [Pyxidicoccus fallax]NMO17481.1 DUF2381 family protein [Pyxidicoccus fallax]NPC77724.1 DUF2381 family protein [Pyxidicoccus fallax]
MLQPIRLALALALFCGAAPRADAASGRAKRERPVAVVDSDAVPLPEIRVDKATSTLLFFPAAIAKSTLTVDEQPRTVDKAAIPVNESRIRVLDMGERSIIVQAVEDLRPGERHELAVFFADGRAPARASFVLMTDPAEVDARIDVERREPPNADCPAEASRPSPRPEDFVLLGYVDDHGVQTEKVDEASNAGQGLSSQPGVSYRGKGWVLVDVQIENSASQRPWAPREATLTGRRGFTLPARLVTVDGGKIAPGKTQRVLAVAVPPPPDAGPDFVLQIRGEGGRGLTIPRVRFQELLTEPHP